MSRPLGERDGLPGLRLGRGQVAALPAGGREQAEQPGHQRVRRDPVPGAGTERTGHGERLLHQPDQVDPAPEVGELAEQHGQAQQILQRTGLAQPRVRTAQIGQVRIEAADRGGLAGPAAVRADLVRQPQRPGRVPRPQLRGRRIGGEPGPAERPQRLQHAEPGALPGVPHHQRAVDQVRQRTGVAADRHHGGVLDGAGEDREPLEQGPLLVVEQTVGPLDDVAQRPVPRRGRPAAAAQHLEGVGHRVEQAAQAQRERAGGGELESEGKPVEAAAQLGDQLDLVGLGDGTRVAGPDPVGEQLRSRRRVQRLDSEHVLPVHA